MSEIIFIFKCLAITAAITVALQLQMGGESLETKVESYLEKSQVARWIQESAAGGALFLRTAGNEMAGKAQQFISPEEKRASSSENAHRRF